MLEPTKSRAITPLPGPSPEIVAPAPSAKRADAPLPEAPALDRRLFEGPQTGTVNHKAQARPIGLTLRNTPAQLRAQGALRALETGAGAEKALDERSFQEALTAFRAASDPQAALQKLRTTAPAFAETAALYGFGSNDPAGAFLHYAINTSGPVNSNLGGSDRTLKLAAAYGKKLGYHSVEREGDRVYGRIGDRRIELMRWNGSTSDAQRLRELGHALNRGVGINERVVPLDRVELDAASPTYSDANAYWSAQLSNMAYDDPAKIEAYARANGFTNFKWINNRDTDTQAFVISNDKAAFVVFRGSSSVKDFVIDGQFAKTKGHGGSVHKGFDRAVKSVWPELERELAKLDDTPVIFTGHSLGSAAATLAAATHAERGGRVDGVYCYGGPRVGDAKFAEHYNKLLGSRTYLHINDRDLVTRVPPDFVGYAEVGHEKRVFDDDGNMRVESIRRRNKIVSALAAPATRVLENATQQHQLAVASILGAIKAQSNGSTAQPPHLTPEIFAKMRFLPEPLDDHFQQNYARLTGEQVLRRRLEGQGR